MRRLQERVQRLEESAGFADHELSGLKGAFEDINRVLVALVKRVESLERRIDALNQPTEAEELSGPGFGPTTGLPTKVAKEPTTGSTTTGSPPSWPSSPPAPARRP